MTEALRYARLFLLRPAAAAEESKKPRALAWAAAIYAAFTLGYMLFFWLKPWDFPDVNAALPRESVSLLFWVKVMVWQPPLEAVWIALLGAWAVYFERGGLGARMVAGVAWTAAPFVLIILYAQRQGLSRPALATGCAVAFGLFWPFARRYPRDGWRPLAAFMLGVNAIGFVMLAPMIVSLLGPWPGLFEASQIAGGLWLLAAGTGGLRALTGLRLPRAFLCVLFAMFLQIAFALALYFVGAVPKEILKALLYA